MHLTLADITHWSGASDSHRCFIEGKRLVAAGNLFQCGKVTSGSGMIKISARCLSTSSLKGQHHTIQGSIKDNGTIISVACSCPAGLSGKCKHAMANPFILLDVRSVIKSCIHSALRPLCLIRIYYSDFLLLGAMLISSRTFRQQISLALGVTK